MGEPIYFQEYLASRRLAADISGIAGPANEFYTLIMTAMRFADTDNLDVLSEYWPGLYRELKERYNAPGGALTPDELTYLDRYNEHSED